MAHIIVYLERSSGGLHPGSQVALCLARDIASQRGATVTSVCEGDAGDFDRLVVQKAGSLGTDQLLFVGPKGLDQLVFNLRPQHVLGSASNFSKDRLEQLNAGPLTRIWLQDPDIDIRNLPRVIGTFAGSLPWYNLRGDVEPEYASDVGSVAIPSRVQEYRSPPEDTSKSPKFAYLASSAVDSALASELRNIGAQPITAQQIENLGSITVLYLGESETMNPELRDRPSQTRCVWLPGPKASIQDDWGDADWILPGSWGEAVRQLHSSTWREALV